jgi:hypothetical protein
MRVVSHLNLTLGGDLGDNLKLRLEKCCLLSRFVAIDKIWYYR